jgi:archaellum component FlaC
MSTSSTISSLQQALSCAGSCDCCDKLQQQINGLRNQFNSAIGDFRNQANNQKQEINRLKKRVDNLEKYGSNKQQPPDSSLLPIYKRLSKAETDILDLGGIVKSVIDDVDFTNQSIKEHNDNANSNQNIFKDIVLALLED